MLMQLQSIEKELSTYGRHTYVALTSTLTEDNPTFFAEPPWVNHLHLLLLLLFNVIFNINEIVKLVDGHSLIIYYPEQGKSHFMRKKYIKV